MSEPIPKRLITAREAEAFIPPLDRFAGNCRIRAKLLNWLNRPPENDSNLLIEGDPGTGKTSILIAYLREQFKNPNFYNEDMQEERKNRGGQVSVEEVREWQKGTGKIYHFKQIDGATDKPPYLTVKIEEVLHTVVADHVLVLIDELGEVFFNGYDEMLRPMLTEATVTAYATAQNFHSKRKTDSSKEEDQRLSALLRRFSHREVTEKPTEADHLKFLVYLIGEWDLKVDHPSTLRSLVQMSDGIVGYTKRILVKAIDEPERRLTRKLVEESDVDPLS